MPSSFRCPYCLTRLRAHDYEPLPLLCYFFSLAEKFDVMSTGMSVKNSVPRCRCLARSAGSGSPFMINCVRIRLRACQGRAAADGEKAG